MSARQNSARFRSRRRCFRSSNSTCPPSGTEGGVMKRIYTVVVLLSLSVGIVGCSGDPEVLKKAYVKSGDAYMAEKKFTEATIEYRNAMQQDPRFAEARLKLGEAYLQLGDFVNGYKEYVRGADLAPDDLDAQVKTGELLLLGSRF